MESQTQGDPHLTPIAPSTQEEVPQAAQNDSQIMEDTVMEESSNLSTRPKTVYERERRQKIATEDPVRHDMLKRIKADHQAINDKKKRIRNSPGYVALASSEQVHMASVTMQSGAYINGDPKQQQAILTKLRSSPNFLKHTSDEQSKLEADQIGNLMNARKKKSGHEVLLNVKVEDPDQNIASTKLVGDQFYIDLSLAEDKDGGFIDLTTYEDEFDEDFTAGMMGDVLRELEHAFGAKMRLDDAVKQEDTQGGDAGDDQEEDVYYDHELDDGEEIQWVWSQEGDQNMERTIKGEDGHPPIKLEEGESPDQQKYEEAVKSDLKVRNGSMNRMIWYHICDTWLPAIQSLHKKLDFLDPYSLDCDYDEIMRSGKLEEMAMWEQGTAERLNSFLTRERQTREEYVVENWGEPAGYIELLSDDIPGDAEKEPTDHSATAQKSATTGTQTTEASDAMDLDEPEGFQDAEQYQTWAEEVTDGNPYAYRENPRFFIPIDCLFSRVEIAVLNNMISHIKEYEDYEAWSFWPPEVDLAKSRILPNKNRLLARRAYMLLRDRGLEADGMLEMLEAGTVTRIGPGVSHTSHEMCKISQDTDDLTLGPH